MRVEGRESLGTHEVVMTRAQGREARGRIDEGVREAKKRNKPWKSYGRDEENGEDLGGKRKKCKNKT